MRPATRVTLWRRAGLAWRCALAQDVPIARADEVRNGDRALEAGRLKVALRLTLEPGNEAARDGLRTLDGRESVAPQTDLRGNDTRSKE